MTGYGRGAVESRGMRAAVEIRAVNHRFLDIKLRGSQLAPELEDAVTAAVRKRLERGAVNVTVRVEQPGDAAAVQIDREAARRVHAELSALRQELGIDELVTLALVCSQPGVLVSRADDSAGEDTDRDRSACVQEALAQALDALVRMRETEGAALARDLGGRFGRLSELAEEIAGHAQVAPAEARQRLEERLSRLVEGTGIAIPPERLAQEVAILADRLDVTEELVRLRSHLEHAEVMCTEAAGGVGRRLDFLVQEMGRELNTIASKSHALPIARAVVEAKAELERVREQVQNIE
jgi:uncharacterized protein (TIGR00255 family)